MSLPTGPNPSPGSRPHGRAAARLACAALAAVLAGAPLPNAGHASASVPPQLAGSWQLNLKESDTLQQKLEAMRGSAGGPGFRGGGGMGGGPPGDGMGGRHGGYGGPRPEGGGHGAGRDSTRRARMLELAHPPMSLYIEPGDGTFVLSERGRAIEVLVLGDDAAAGASIQPDAPHAQAQWKGKRLIAEMVGSRGGRMTQELELSDHDTKLTIITRLEGREGRPPLELKRVYNRSESDEPEPSLPALLPPTALPDSSRQ